MTRPTPKSVSKSHLQATILQPPQNLTNRLSSLTSAFVHKTGQDLDIKYQLTWNFGLYLTAIPRRLGRSAALDAATDVLVHAHTRFCTEGFSSNPTLLAKYSRAFAVLRHDIDDAAKARSSETLCAVMVLSIVKVRCEPHSINLCGCG